jgi:RNA-dependent RNA polymerase
MNRGYGSRTRGNMGRGGFSCGRGGSRTYSGSSGSSGGQYNYNRPVLRPTSSPRDGAAPPARQNHTPTPVNSPITPVDSPTTPAREHSDFTMNGHSISETYTPRGSSAATSPVSPSPSTHTNHRGNVRPRQHALQRPVTRNSQMGENYDQEYRIKILGVPKACWTKQIYEVMSQYGNVVRINIDPNARDNNAFVTYM